ncbi:hypothetical protein BJX96DRAFT_151707 [Aspergillus floccosus]
MLPELCIALWWLTQYSYAMVIQTIAIVEQSQSGITDSLRTTISHLRAQIGPFFWLRGLLLFIAYDFAWSALLPALFPIEANTWQEHLRSLLLAGLLANIQVLWVHVIITKPSAKYIHQRLPGARCWTRVVPAILFDVITNWFLPQYTLELASRLATLTGFMDVQDILNSGGPQALRPGYKLGALSLIPYFIISMATLPARTGFIRIAASMLPDNDEPIVPLDPRLKTNPPTGVLDAWRSIPDDTWARAWRIQARAYILSASIFFLGKMAYSDFHRFATIPMMWFNS